jgi:hypothetical protein
VLHALPMESLCVHPNNFWWTVTTAKVLVVRLIRRITAIMRPHQFPVL